MTQPQTFEASPTEALAQTLPSLVEIMPALAALTIPNRYDLQRLSWTYDNNGEEKGALLSVFGPGQADMKLASMGAWAWKLVTTNDSGTDRLYVISGVYTKEGVQYSILDSINGRPVDESNQEDAMCALRNLFSHLDEIQQDEPHESFLSRLLLYLGNGALKLFTVGNKQIKPTSSKKS